MTIEQREQAFKEQVHRMIGFPYEMRVEFFEYWSEPNKSGTKMRFELEKTWDLKRRMNRWLQNNQKPVYRAAQPLKPEYKEIAKMNPTNEIEALDQLLNNYVLHPTTVPFDEFGKWYDYLKERKLLRPFTAVEVDQLRKVYNGDNTKCRCAVVQMTFDGYVNSGFTFKKVFEVREKLEAK